MFIRDGHVVLTSASAAGLAQFNKAELAFSRMSDFDSKFRAPDQRHPGCAPALSEPVIPGAAQGHPGTAAILAVDGVEQPVFGRYRIERQLGKGAMGTVYLGRDPANDRVAAVKTMALPQESGADDLRKIKARFFREAQTAGRLRHPAIVNIFDVGEERGFVYIAMEFMPGGDLTPFIEPGRLLPLSRVLSIITQVAEALSYVHAGGVVHRDIKPANIMCELGSNAVKLTDFGIARIADGRAGMVVGTPSYMSPEQLCGQELEGRSDLFSLGVTLYQLSCGSLPFQGGSLAQLMFGIANAPHADILACNPALPPALAEIIDKALAKQPQNRYQTGKEMARALRSCISSAASAGKAGSANIIHRGR